MTGINHLPPNNNLPLLNKGVIPKGAPLQNQPQAQSHQAQSHQVHQQTPQQQVRQQTQLPPRKPQQAAQPQIPQQNIPPQLLHVIRTPISLTASSHTIARSVILPEITQIFNQISDLLAQNNSALALKFQQNIPNPQTHHFARKILQYLTQIGKTGENYQSLLEGLNLNQAVDKQLKQLFGRLGKMSQHILHDKDGDAWQRMFLPLLSDKQMQFITLYVPYHGQQQQKQKQKQKPKKQEEKTQRFILSFDFSGTGMIEIDLYMEQKRIYMVLRTIKKVDAVIQQMMRELIENVTASMGMDGFLAFQQSATLIDMPLDANGNILGENILSGKIL